MGDFGHEPAPSGQTDSAATVARNARAGLWLFAAYLLLYGGFVAASAFRPQALDILPLWGINLAVLYGLALIVAALLLALVYAWICRVPAEQTQEVHLQ